MDRARRYWSTQDAKARFSEVLDLVENGDEQVITRHGRMVAKIVPYDGSARAEKKTGASLVDFLNNSPLRGSGLKIPKRVGKVSLKPRKVDLW